MDIKPDESATQLQDFNSSIKKAEASGLKVAWSNDSFELWFLLHFQNIAATIGRRQINIKLRKEWDLKDWEVKPKSEMFCRKNYDRHIIGQLAAIKNAQALHQQYAGRADYAAQNPCTTVYLLVQELNKYLKP